MKLTSILLSFLIAGSMVTPDAQKRTAPSEEKKVTKKEIIAKSSKLARAFIDIYMGLIIMDGAKYQLEDGWLDFSKFEASGISLFTHGACTLYNEVTYADLKGLYAYFKTIMGKKEAILVA